MKLIESKGAAWAAMVLVVAIVVISILLRTPWYGMIAEFLLFMAVFSHLASLYLQRMSPAAGKKLETCALVIILMSIVAFIVEYIIFL